MCHIFGRHTCHFFTRYRHLLRPGGGAYRSGTGKTDLEITPRPGDYPLTTNRHLRPAGLPIRLTAPVSTAAVQVEPGRARG